MKDFSKMTKAEFQEAMDKLTPENQLKFYVKYRELLAEQERETQSGNS